MRNYLKINLFVNFSIQTYHRFILIVHFQCTSFRSMNLYIKIILLQWIIYPLLLLPIILNKNLVYQSEKFVCQISFSNTSLFIYLLIISYGIPVFFIIILHICIAHRIKQSWKFHRQRRLSDTYIIYPIQRIALIVLVLIISYLRYGIFWNFENFQLSLVHFAQKIGLVFSCLSFTLTMILIFVSNRSTRKSCFLLFYRSERLRMKDIVYKSSRK